MARVVDTSVLLLAAHAAMATHAARTTAVCLLALALDADLTRRALNARTRICFTETSDAAFSLLTGDASAAFHTQVIDCPTESICGTVRTIGCGT